MNRRLSLPELLIAGLAAYRLTRLYQQDTIAEPLRDRISDRLPAPGATMYPNRIRWEKQWDAARSDFKLSAVPEGRPRPNTDIWSPVYVTGQEAPVMYEAPKGTFVGELLNCFYCLGVWSSFAILIARRTRLRPLVDALAVAAVTIGIRKHLES